MPKNATRSISAMRDIRARRSSEQFQENKADMRVRVGQLRESQSQEARDERNQQRQLERRETRRFIVDRRRGIDQQRQQVHRALTSDSFLRLAFQYEPDVEYYAHSKVLVKSLLLWKRNARIVMHLNSKMSQLGCVAHLEKYN
ncbi:hypothetical protein WA026_009347 [Henosepilachna vigintioctopunctata]|uniref:Uncharacterized protein n=2 Tax=Henosepilachna vigintioctopunctata TaxID=420089 RepID=A0AAW1TXZ7_9CUCU